MRRQRQDKNYWNKYENYNWKSSFDKLNYNKPSLDKFSSNEEVKKVINDNKREKVMYKSLKDNKREI